MADEKELQKKYIQLHLFREQFKAMAEEKGSLENRINELLVSIDTLQKLSSIKQGEEILSSVGSGAFLRSDIKDINSVLIGVGAGVVIKKERNQAVEILRSRLEELVRINNELAAELQKYSQQMERLEEQLRELAEQSEK